MYGRSLGLTGDQPHGHLVVQGAAEDLVPDAADDDVLAVVTIGEVETVAPGGHAVALGAAEDVVVVGASLDRVAALLAVDGVVAGAAEDLVVAGPAADDVVTAHPVDTVVAVASLDEVVVGGAVDRVVAVAAAELDALAVKVDRPALLVALLVELATDQHVRGLRGRRDHQGREQGDSDQQKDRADSAHRCALPLSGSFKPHFHRFPIGSLESGLERHHSRARVGATSRGR